MIADNVEKKGGVITKSQLEVATKEVNSLPSEFVEGSKVKLHNMNELKSTIERQGILLYKINSRESCYKRQRTPINGNHEASAKRTKFLRTISLEKEKPLCIRFVCLL